MACKSARSGLARLVPGLYISAKLWQSLGNALGE